MDVATFRKAWRKYQGQRVKVIYTSKRARSNTKSRTGYLDWLGVTWLKINFGPSRSQRRYRVADVREIIPLARERKNESKN